MWTMLSNRNICLGSGPHRGTFIYIAIDDNWLIAKASSFGVHPPLFDGPNPIHDRPWNIIHLLPCRTPCRISIYSSIFDPLGYHGLVYNKLGPSMVSQPTTSIVHHSPRPSSYSVKWALLWVENNLIVQSNWKMMQNIVTFNFYSRSSSSFLW